MSKYAETHEKMLLNKLHKYIDEEEYKYESPYITKADVEVIIPALEKQIPKKPNKCFDFASSLFICPTCYRKQRIMYEQYYCKECGQKLDYSDEQ